MQGLFQSFPSSLTPGGPADHHRVGVIIRHMELSGSEAMMRHSRSVTQFEYEPDD